MAAGAGWGYFILNLFLLLAVADATVAALAALFVMRSNNWRTAGMLQPLSISLQLGAPPIMRPSIFPSPLPFPSSSDPSVCQEAPSGAVSLMLLPVVLLLALIRRVL